MKKFLLFSLCLFSFVFIAGSIYAFEEAVNFSYMCRDLKGADRWHAEAEIKNIAPGVYIMTEKAEGIYSSFKGRVSWVADMKFERTKDKVRPMSLDKRVFDADGKMIRRERQEFDLSDNTATCVHEEPARKISRVRKFKFDRDVVTRLSLGFYAQKFLASGKTTEKLQMVSEEPKVYNIELRRMEKEMIKINNREIEAYRLCVDPELGVFDFVKVFLPKSYAWHSVVPNYEWLGYAGLEGDINSEKVEIFIEDYDKQTF